MVQRFAAINFSSVRHKMAVNEQWNRDRSSLTSHDFTTLGAAENSACGPLDSNAVTEPYAYISLYNYAIQSYCIHSKLQVFLSS